MQFAWGDGSVRFLPENTEQTATTYAALLAGARLGLYQRLFCRDCGLDKIALRMKSRFTLFVLLVVALGCSQSTGPKLAKVTGTVKLDGVPVDGAGLEFIADAGGVAYGRSGASGNYYMSFGSSRTGAIVGRNLVRITAGDQVTVGDRKFESKEIFPKKYNVNSELYVDVASGRNRLDFNCESAGFNGASTTASRGGN